MRYLSTEEIITLRARVISQSGSVPGIRDHGALETAAAQPGMTFDGKDLYPEITDSCGAWTLFD